MKTTLNNLIELLPKGLSRTDAINRLESAFTRLGLVDDFYALLHGSEVEANVDIDRIVNAITNAGFISPDSKRFIEARRLPANLNKLDETIAKELGVDIKIIRVESHTRAYREYAAELNCDFIEEAETLTKLCVHRELLRLLNEQPLEALKLIRGMVGSAVLFKQPAAELGSGKGGIQVMRPIAVTTTEEELDGDVLDGEYTMGG